MHSLAFEGDFIETHDGLIFDVKGLLHPEDRKIAYLRYIPARFFNPGYKNAKKTEKKRITQNIEKKFGVSIADIRFGKEVNVKLYDIPSRFKILSHFKPEYIYQTKLYDFPLQSVPNQDIKTIHAPEAFLNDALKSTTDHTLRNLVEFLHKGGNIPLNCIGLSGSPMVGLEGLESDYDIIVYGADESKKVHSLFREKFSHSQYFTSGTSKIKAYKGRALKKHFKSRAQGFPIKYEDFTIAEREKTHQFLIDGKDVFIRYIKFRRSDANLPQFENYSFRNLGRISLKGTIIEDSQSIFTPGQYILKITENKSEYTAITGKEIEIFTLRGRFLEQARIGDEVLVNGKLEQKSDLHEDALSQRVVIGTDPEDLMIQIRRSKEKFN